MRKHLFLGFTISMCLFLGLGGGDTSAQNGSLTPGSADELLYAPQTPVLAVDKHKNVIAVWQDFRPGSENLLLMQKSSSSGSPLWNQNQVIARPYSTVEFLSADTDNDGNLYVSWVNQRERGQRRYVSLNKYDPNGTPLWDEPLTVATAYDPIVGFQVTSLSPVRVDNNGNAYFFWMKKNLATSELTLWYQVVNSERYARWEEGKQLRSRPGMPMLEQFPVDLELNKKDSLAYITWVDASPNLTWKTINIQKINYDGAYQWYTPYPIHLGSDERLLDYPGLALDGNENIFAPYLASSGPNQNFTTSFHFKRINRFGQELWNDLDTLTLNPSRMLGHVAMTVDNHSKIYFVLDSKDELALYAYKPGLDSSHSADWEEMYQLLLRKDLPQAGSVSQGHTHRQGIARVDDSHIAVAWNEYQVSFQRLSDGSLTRISSDQERVALRIYDSLLNDTHTIWLDSASFTGSERFPKVSVPSVDPEKKPLPKAKSKPKATKLKLRVR